MYAVCSVVHLFNRQSLYFPPYNSVQAIRRTLYWASSFLQI